MHIVVTGLNHQTAPVELRERLSLSGDRLIEAHDALRRLPGVHEAVVLSTCNRTEVYTVSICPAAGEGAARTLLAGAGDSLYVHRGQAAVEHLFSVAAGIDSLIVGESQILRQVRCAAEGAQESGAGGRILGALFQEAVRTGKRARTETGIGRHTLSIASAAVELGRRSIGTLAGRTVMVIGTGTMAAHAVAAIQRYEAARILLVSRSAGRAADQALALSDGRCEIEAVPGQAMETRLPEADLVIAATKSSEPLLRRVAVENAVAGRAERMVLVDVAVPRNIAADVRGLRNTMAYDIDDLKGLVDSNLAARQREVAHVREIVTLEACSFLDWMRALWVQPIISDLRSKADEIRRGELERTMRRMDGLSERERAMVDALTQSIVSRILHDPTLLLKQRAVEGDGYPFAEALRELFRLTPVAAERPANAEASNVVTMPRGASSRTRPAATANGSWAPKSTQLLEAE